MKHLAKRGAAALLALSFVLAACGDDDDDAAVETDAPVETEAPVESDQPADTELPVETDAPVETEIPVETDPAEEALRVVSLSPTHTEMMFAIGAGDQLVAVDDFSNYPPAALELPNDLSGFEPNVEAIAGYEPDVVLIGGDFSGLGEQLASIGIDSWDGPAAQTLDDTYIQITQLGELTGQEEEAAALVAEMQEDIEEIVSATETTDPPLSYYHELDPTLFSVTSDTFIGQLYTLLGLRNVADELETDAGAFPQLNAEFLVAAAPEMVFLADTKCCGETAVTVSERPGWETVPAVVNGNVFEMDDDIASRWGPRVVDYLAAVSAAVEDATAS